MSLESNNQPFDPSNMTTLEKFAAYEAANRSGVDGTERSRALWSSFTDAERKQWEELAGPPITGGDFIRDYEPKPQEGLLDILKSEIGQSFRRLFGRSDKAE